jgi:hypothetical protein
MTDPASTPGTSELDLDRSAPASRRQEAFSTGSVLIRKHITEDDRLRRGRSRRALRVVCEQPLESNIDIVDSPPRT